MGVPRSVAVSTGPHSPARPCLNVTRGSLYVIGDALQPIAHPKIRIVQSKDVTRRSVEAIDDSEDASEQTVGVIAHPKIRIVRSKDVTRRSVEVIGRTKDATPCANNR